MATYNPKYTVAIIARDSMQYDVTPAITKLTLQENDGEIAQRVTITMSNLKVNNSYLSAIFGVGDRVFVYGNDGNQKEEVFRGFVWTDNGATNKSKSLTLTCYDNLIYFMESEEYQFFSAGYSTKSICEALCEAWSIGLSYRYDSITHPKLPLRGNLADIFLSDLLDEVKKKTGAKYIMRSEKDTVVIDFVGCNTTVYKLTKGKNGNAIEASSETTMQGMVTKVVILGKEDDNERAAVEDIVEGNTSEYGTLQKILNVSSGTTLEEVKQEAEELIHEKGNPKTTYSVTSVNVPWVRKGDKVEVNAGDLSGDFIVKSITHYGSDKTMTLEVEKA